LHMVGVIKSKNLIYIIFLIYFIKYFFFKFEIYKIKIIRFKFIMF
jgi:hypothetical protein